VADLNPSPLAEPNGAFAPARRGGLFNALARSQYRALAAMRWNLFRNSLRSPQGIFEFGARTIAFVFYAFLGLALAAGFGGGTYAIAATRKWEWLPVVFWAVFLVWQVVPVSLASFQEQFDIGGLLRFPVGFGPFFLLHLIFGIVDASTILGCLCCAGIFFGILIARPELAASAALALTVFAALEIDGQRRVVVAIEEAKGRGFDRRDEDGDRAGGEFPQRCGALLLHIGVGRKILKREHVVGGKANHASGIDGARKFAASPQGALEGLRRLVIGNQYDDRLTGRAGHKRNVEGARSCRKSGNTPPPRSKAEMPANAIKGGGVLQVRKNFADEREDHQLRV